MQLALSLGRSQIQVVEERGGALFFLLTSQNTEAVIPCLNYGKCNAEHQPWRNWQSPVITAAHIEKLFPYTQKKKRAKKAGIPVTYQLHLLTSQLVIQECSPQERDGT